MTSYYNPSKWLSEYAAALLSPYIKLENEGGDGSSSSGGQKEADPTQTSSTPSSSLSVGLWSGNVELKNVELRPEAFERFLNCKESNDNDNNGSAAQIKWKLVQGSIDSVKIQIPWKSLLVGSAHSSSKCSVQDDGDNNQGKSKKDGHVETTKKVQGVDGVDDPPTSYASGCTTVQIQGVKLLLGYEVIHQNPMLNTLQQCQQNMYNAQNSNPYSAQERPEKQLQKKIREEKNRILQIAERRLLAGLDPFPPPLMEGLQSIIASSIFQQSAAIMHSTLDKSTDGDDNASIVSSNTNDTVSSPIKSYRSMMGNYLSSTIKSLLWSVFDSLSLSVTEVKLSVVGSSHYDKDFASLLRKEQEKARGEGEANNEKILEQQKIKQEQQKKKKNIRKRDFRNAAAARSRHRLHLRSSYGRSSTNSSLEEDEDAENNDDSQQQQQSRKESISEDPSIWAREGHVEMGITLDRFDVKPGPLTSTDDGVKTDSIALKLVQFQGVGVFLRRKCPMISKDGGAWENYVNDASSGLHTGKTLVWNDMEVDDYVVLPTNMDASCKVYRNSSGSTSVKLDASSSSSPRKRKTELSDVHSKASGIDTKSTTNTKRRGKRDKRKKGAEPVPTTSQRGHSVLSAGTIPSTATATSGRGTRGDVRTKGDPSYEYDSFTPPNRLELCLEMGHVRSSVSPRQLFLLHSFSSSMTRAKRGRPPITIRAAQAHDKALIERMTEERQSMLAWEEHIYREAPSLRSRSSRQSTRTLPGVVLSWWRYAFFNIVHEIQERKALLDRCSGDSIHKEERGNRGSIFTRSMGFQRAWDWTTQSRIRKEYIDLYLMAHKPTTATPPAYDAAAVAAAKLRLEQIEDDLSVERVLLLKHVAKAASISERPDNAQQTPIKSSSVYYNLRQRTLKEGDSLADGNVLQSLSPLGYDSRATHLSLSPRAHHFREASAPLAARTKQLDKEGHTIQNTTILSGSKKEPRDTISFSAQFFLSGFSLAVCDFSLPDGTNMEYNEVGQYSRPYQTDDISVLTDCFHDDEDGSKTPKHVAYGGESFDPACRFWPSMRHGIYCGPPIVLLHIADIAFSAQSLAIDKLHPPHMENEFSVGGISVQYGVTPSQQSIFCLGHVPRGDEPRTKLIPNRSIGVSGCFGSSKNNSALRIGPADIIVDYDWLESILRFAKANTGIGPSNSTLPLKYEDLLVRAVSKNTTNYNISATLEFDKLSVTIPVHRTADTDNNDENDKLFLITTVNQLHIKTGNLYDSSCNDSDKTSASMMETDLLPSQDLLVVLDDLDTTIVRQSNVHTANTRTITRLLRRPIKMQFQYSSGAGNHSLEEPLNACKSYDVKSSAIHVLVSELRLRTLVDTLDTISSTFNKAINTPESKQLLPKPFIPLLAEYVLSESKLSIQSLSIHIICDGEEERPTDNLHLQEQLEDIIASYISQLSCLDFKHPSDNAIACTSRLMVDRCCALGMPEHEARQCSEAAEANYKRETGDIFYPPLDHEVTNAKRFLRRRTSNRGGKKGKAFVEIDPEALSAALDKIVNKVTSATLSEFSHVLLQLDPNYSRHELAINVESLVVSRSLLYYGNTVQINVKSFAVSNEQARLLRMRPHMSGIQPSSPHSEVEKKSLDENETALTISLHEREATPDHDYNQEIYFEAGFVESTFSPEAYLEAINSTKAVLDAARQSGTQNTESTTHPQRPVKDIIINGSVSSMIIALTDKLVPFIECRFQDVSMAKSVVESHATTKTSLHACTVCLDCVYQSTYPNIISTYPPSDNGDIFGGRSAFTIQLTSPNNPDLGPSEILIGLDGVRIVMLRQILNEILQYTSSPNYGIGRFLSSMSTGSDADTHDACQALPKLQVSINNSSITLPRDSKSIDMIGVEVEEISFTREQVSETWSTDGYSFATPPSERKVTTPSSSEVFFDCIDDDQFKVQQSTIPRFVVDVRHAHIFTALNKNHFSSEKIHMPEFNANVQHTGRADHGKSPFMVCGRMNKSTAKDVKSRVWEKVTTEPLSLGVKVDFAPKLRLWIEDYVAGCSSRGVSFDMRMSQFYLLMSIWFSNMKEMPLVYPYELDLVEESSMDPDSPTDWPDYGTSEFVKRLKGGGNAKETFEMALCFKHLNLRCSYDHSSYFAKVPPTMSMMGGIQDEAADSSNFISVSLGDAICSITMDDDTLQRIGLGATSITIHDGRLNEKDLPFQEICIRDNKSGASFVDQNWGLDCGRHTLIDGLPLPFQLTVFLTPDRRCLINLGLDMAEAALVDLSPIWILLDYFGLYFKECEYGHPAFEAEMMFQKSTDNDEIVQVCDNDECMSIDFRLWMIQPHVIIPSDDEICVMLEAAGLYYRYKSFGVNYSSQEIVARDLGIVVLREYMEPSLSRGIRQVSGSLLSGCGAKTLIDGLSFSIRYDYNSSTNYIKFALRVPLISKHFNHHSMDGIESSNIEAKPFFVPLPVVCKPFETPSRTMGHNETSIYFSHEYMKLALKLLTDFVGPSQQNDDSAGGKSANPQQTESPTESIFSVTMHVERVKLVISDPIMGMHRPVLSICVPSLLLTASQLKEIHTNKTKLEKLTGSRNTACNPKDLQASMEATIFIDYFKLGLTRNWEPFVEPFKCLVLYEKSVSRGKGITFNADCPLHFNVTSALIDTLDDAVKTFDFIFRPEESVEEAEVPSILSKRHSTVDSGVRKSVSTDEKGHHLTFIHSSAEEVEDNERVAFSLKNNTGERVRIHTHSDLEKETTRSQTTISYLDHLHLMPLSFPATETVIKNLQPVEVLFKGDITRSHHQKQPDTAITSHEIDLQIPGFRWVRNISFDLSGKNFVQLIPRSPYIQAKIDEDWRLKNALHMLAEVNSVNGGRRLTITSPFEVVNKTNHPIFLAINPDPRHSPEISKEDKASRPDSTDEANQKSQEKDNFIVEKLNPDESHSLSYLLIESALGINGKHLGSLWIRPDQSSSDDFRDEGLDNSTIGYPSRPLQLAKVLHESSAIFKDSNGNPSIANQVASNIEVSCPIFDQSKTRSSRPFCYVVEVKRSPFARASSAQAEIVKPEETWSSPARMGKGLKTAKNMFNKNNAPKAEIHAPIAYSLVIHPPLVIENLLPERGRFELMDANSKNVLWWGSLEAGERVSVFTVGLDAPLLLLVNLGFCKTVVGEGALIHQGGGDGLLKAGWNTIGSAVKTSKDKVKKTLSTITESKDNRGKAKLGMIKTGNMKQNAANRKVGQLGFNTENDIIESSGGALLKRGDGYGIEDIATELNVIDSQGQRLTLLIDNTLGSGGQRRVSLYSPYWIVNTTEHSLRYKQEKSLSCVAGTVLSAEKDGSKPVDGGQRCTVDEEAEEDGLSLLPGGSNLSGLDSLDTTIFSGRPGAMALLKKSLNNNPAKPALLAALISEDLPLCVLSKLAFMFNFQDVLSIGGSPRLCIQLADTRSDASSRYTSAWSSGFGLESIGVTQIVGMHCKDGRKLEASVSISIAPGRLSNYTKIVRICPRYIVVNQLPRPIRLWQDNSIHHPNLAVEHSSKSTSESEKWVFSNTPHETPGGIINQYELLFGSPTVIDCSEEASDMDARTTAHRDACYIATVHPSELVAFHLPDTRLERLLRVDYGPSWYLSPSFAADIPGEYVLAMSPSRDLRMLPHVTSRGAPVYSVTFPPPNNNVWSGELGVWFETDPWGRERALIVKGIKEGSYSSYFTDIIVGDQLIMIDDISVEQLTFDQAMKYLKTRLAEAKEAAESASNQSSSRPLPLQIRRSKSKKRFVSTDNTQTVASKIVTLTFLTLEERLRRLRRAAVSKNASKAMGSRRRAMSNDSEMMQLGADEHHEEHSDLSKELLVDMKFLFQSVFVFLRAPDPKDPPHRVINRSLHWKIYYRQRGCDAHPWQCLSPGESAAYTWEEPLKAKKLSVRVGVGEWIAGELGKHDRIAMGDTFEGTKKSRTPLFSFQFIQNEEQGHFGAIKTVKLEEIGYFDKLPCPARGYKGSNNEMESSLCCQVDTEGATRVLIVSDEMSKTQVNDDITLVRRNLTNIRREISEEENRRSKIDALHNTVTLLATSTDPHPVSPKGASMRIPLPSIGESTTSTGTESKVHRNPKNDDLLCRLADSDAIESELQYYMDYDEGLFITRSNQVVVEVMEATGLRSSDLNGLSNPYVQVGLVCTNKKRRTGSFRNKDVRSTYYVEKTLSPQWVDQKFVFNVPEKASSDPKETRRFSIQCVIKSTEKFGKDKFLGQAHVHLRNLMNQKENVGWYPLMGKLGQSSSGKDHLDRICGSLRLRVQWVHDTPGLLEYYILCADQRLETLRRSKEGMKRQLKSLQDAAKQEKERGESSLMSSVQPAMAAIYSKKQPKFRRGKSVESDNDTTKEEKAIQPSKVIKGGVLATKGRLRNTINAAMSMKKPKRSSVDDRHSILSDYSSILDNVIDIDDLHEDDDCSSSDDMFDDDSLGSSELLVVDGDSEAAFSTHPRKTGNKKTEWVNNTSDGSGLIKRNTLYNNHNTMSQNHPRSQLEHAHLLSVRWKCWQHYINNSLELVPTHPFYQSWNISHVFINGNAVKPQRPTSSLPTAHTNLGGDQDMVELLKLPPAAPQFILERENNHVCELMQSRSSFSKAAGRSLGSVLNPGGVLTIRPITALNLPDNYTGMFVKLRYGNKICLSETVDSIVSPVWNDGDFYRARRNSSTIQSNRQNLQVRRENSNNNFSDWDDIAERVNPTRARGVRQNDLDVQVLPFETSKSLRISVIGETKSLQTKVEIGALEIPLGPALECCAQSMEEYDEDRNKLNPKGLPPAYVRWFPLMSPSEAIPIEGDMGKSIRPPESEKLTDDMFEEYFAPCIKLALMFRPNTDEATEDNYDASADSNHEASTDQYMYGRLDRISAALIDSSRIIELLSLSSRDTDVRISVTTAKTRLAVAVGNIQVDQQSQYHTKVPVILSPTPVKHPEPLVQFLAWKDNYRSKSDMDSYEYVAIQVQEMDLKVEESWLYDLWEFYLDVVKKREARASHWNQQDSTTMLLSADTFEVEVEQHTSDTIEKARLFLKEDKKVKLKKIYVRELMLGFFKVNLSYFKSPKTYNWSNVDLSEEVEAEGQQNTVAADDAYTQWSENMMGDDDERSQHANINIIGAVLPSMSDAPIRFQERIISHVYESEGDIWRSLKSFYSAEALRQLYKIVGSLDFVGNPTMVLTSFRTGLKDFFLQPTRELKHIGKNPSRFGVGVVKGTLSLVSNSTSGIFGFASHLGATVGHTATMLTLDEHFQRLHSEQKAAQQRHYNRFKKKGFGHVTLMISRPVHDIVFGVVSASTGILTEPYRGAKNDGIRGFAKGTGIGIIGIVVKPIVGVSDAFSHVMESIHDIAKSVNLLDNKFKPVERFRLPYVFGSRRMLLPFNQVDARSAQLLFSHPLGKRPKKADEVIIASEALTLGNGLEHYIVVTTSRIVLFRLKVVDGQGFVTVNVVWQVRFEKGTRITSSFGNRGHNGSILYVSRYSVPQKQGNNASESSLHNTNPDESRHSRGGDYFFAEGVEGNYPETPKSFYPLGATTAAFRLRTAWPFAVNEGDGVVRFAVEGDFKQRVQLSRIHNAICCVVGDFDSIVYEGYHNNDRNEGLTSFGPFHFEQQREDVPFGDRARDDVKQSLYSSLEHTAWAYDGLEEPRASFLNSNLSGRPSWLVESRSRGMSPPSNIHPSSYDEMMLQTINELGHSQRTSDSASHIMGEDHCITSPFLGSSVDSRDNNSHTGDPSAQQDTFVNECPSIGSFSIPPVIDETSSVNDIFAEENTQEKSTMIDESVQANIPHPHINQSRVTTTLSSAEEGTNDELDTESCLDGRLRRVEAMLECLVDSPTSNMFSPQTTLSHMSISQYDHDYLSGASSINDLPLPSMTPSQQSYQSHSEQVQVEALLKQVEDLKRQLAAKNEKSTTLRVEIPSVENAYEGVDESTSDRPDPNRKKKLKVKGQIKKLFGRKQR